MKYREVGLLAEGGMAVIAQAERDDGSTVVIKRVRPPFCFDPSFLRLFADEGAVNAALEHENIVHLLDKGEDEAGPYLVFEHVDGTDLGAVLENSPKLDVECVLAIAIPLCKALQFAHEHVLHVVHRDVSPGNVLIGNDGGVKLADFGVAWFTLKSEATVAGEMKGKFAYMAPEQTRGEKVDARADLFSSGIVLWEALAGKRLFDGPTDADVVAAVRSEPAPRLEAVPAKLADLVARMLEKDVDKRPSSAGDVVKELKDIALELGLEDGLSRHAARLARLAPRRELKEREIDARRRTQRVVVDSNAPTIVRLGRRGSRGPLFAAGALVAVAALGFVAMRGRGEVVTPLPDTPTLAVVPPKPDTSPPAPPTPVPVHVDDAPKTEVEHVDVAPPKPTRVEAAAQRSIHVDAGKATAVHADVAKSTPAPHVDVKAAHVEAVKPAAPAGFGRLTVTADPWASVSIDGRLVKKETPLPAFNIEAGHHTLTLTNPQFGTKTVEVDVPVDGNVRQFVDMLK